MKKGFSLIELLVVMSIISVLFGLGYANYRDFARRQVLSSAARQLEGDLSLVAKMASSGQRPTDIPTCSVLNGYILVQSSTGSYKISALCQSSVENEIKTVSLPAGVVFSSPNFSTRVVFKPLGQGMQTGNVVFTLKQSTTGQLSTVTINSSGSISIVENAGYASTGTELPDSLPQTATPKPTATATPIPTATATATPIPTATATATTVPTPTGCASPASNPHLVSSKSGCALVDTCGTPSPVCIQN